jgi:phage I-like protein
MKRSATSQENTGNTLEPQTPLEVRLAKAEARLEALKEIVDLERKQAEELKEERVRWASALETSQRQITDLTKRAEEPPKGWFWFRCAAASRS